MTHEDKQLLLKVLCAGLPYNICVLHDYDKKFDSGLICYLSKVDLENKQLWAYGVFEPLDIENVKPYLRPMSSMTEKEENELVTICVRGGYKYSVFKSYLVDDWLNAHHFDYRGLIEKSLAIVAPEDMYK